MNGIAAIEDDLNREIVKMLQNDGRRPYREIATTLGVSEGTVRNRVQSMKNAGALRIVALVDPTVVRYQADAIIGVRVAANHSVDQVAKRIGESPDVVYILWVTGRFDLLVEVVTNSMCSFHDFLETEIHVQPDIASSEVMSGLKNFKNQFLLKYEWS
ncbi:MAG: Lrp/AsnC family transcriptional regulator [Acidiferrobacterales bacterium]|nr:Lrp/AsnC family transcriptional regulator [Acidiferrobacterales bacterium]